MGIALLNPPYGLPLRVQYFDLCLMEREMEKLKEEFTQAMFEIYRRAKVEAKYPANIFLQMVTDRGGLDTARYLINQLQPSDGYTHLYERGRIDLTVEAMVVENSRWHPLFASEELEKARRRLEEYGYRPRM
jgi:hypothetical protein